MREVRGEVDGILDRARLIFAIPALAFSVVMLLLAFWSYSEAWRLIAEKTDWATYVRNAIASCILMLLFALLVFFSFATALVAVYIATGGE